MRYVVVALFLLASAPLIYWTFAFFQKFQVSRVLIEETTPYQLLGGDYTRTLLVLGDSTGVGVGAMESQDSVAGRLAQAMGATYVENRAVSGAESADVEQQLKQASLGSYEAILIQVGANDIVHFHDAAKSADVLSGAVREAVSRSNTTVLMSAGNVGATTNFPIFMKPFYTRLTLQYHDAFGTMAAQAGAIYVNLYEPAQTDPFVADPDRYLAIDGFHPSSEGYGLWFDRLWKVLKHNYETK